MLGLNEHNVNGVTFYTKGKYGTPPPTTDNLNTFVQWIRHNYVIASIRIHHNKIMISINEIQNYLPPHYEQSKKGAVEFLLKYLKWYIPTGRLRRNQ